MKTEPNSSLIEQSMFDASLSILAIVVVLFVAACGSQDSSQDSARQYSDEELALDEAVDDYIEGLMTWAQYRTFEDKDRDSVDPLAGSGHSRERATFEFLLQSVLVRANESLPRDVATDSGVLYEAEREAKDECAMEMGWPGVQLYDTTQQMGEQYERDYGLMSEMFLDLRHECSKYAATYPTLDPAYRDELLAIRRMHYMTVVRDWVAANPDLVVPVEYHEGANTPIEDHWIRECKKTDDPHQCARDHRVTLP